MSQEKNTQLINRIEKDAVLADGLIFRVYTFFKNRVEHGYGMSSKVRFSESCPISERVIDLANEKANLQACISAQKSSAFTITLTEAVLDCDVAVGGKHLKLNFSKLFWQNQERIKYWRGGLMDLATECVRYAFFLATDIRVFYEIPNQWPILKNGFTPFRGEVEVGKSENKKKFSFGLMSDADINELIQTMNRLISGGQFIRDKSAKDPGVHILIQRAPEVVNENPAFDYVDFCETYEKLTATLLRNFKKIYQNLQLVSRQKQNDSLEVEHALIYEFDQEDGIEYQNFALIGKRSNPHYEQFMQFLNERLMGLLVTDFEFCYGTSVLTNYRNPEVCQSECYLKINFEVVEESAKEGFVPLILESNRAIQ